MAKQQQEAMDFQWARIIPILEKQGFTGRDQRTVQTTANAIKVPFQVSRPWDPERNVTGMAKIQLYSKDAYPSTRKEECILHVWGMTGNQNAAECKKLADALTAGGIPARVTTYKGIKVVAFHAGDWLNAPEKTEEEERRYGIRA